MRILRGFIYIFLGLILMFPFPVAAYSESPLLITELQTRSTSATNGATEEFIEIINVSDEPVDLSRWRVEYKSATGMSWNNKAVMGGVLGAGDIYLLASSGYLTEIADDTFSPGLSDTAGHVRLNGMESGAVGIFDVVGWGETADAAEGDAPAAALSEGKSLQRNKDSSGMYIDSDNNAHDFSLSQQPQPESTYWLGDTDSDSPQSPPITTDPQDTATPPLPPAEADNDIVPGPRLPLRITELLPNPAAPATDSQDEYVELYNPNEASVDLVGYKLQSGMSYSYGHLFQGGVLAGGAYITLTSGETSLSLSNAGSRVRLLDPDGGIIAETAAYEDAREGQAWAETNGTWQWTETLTPGSPNLITLPAVTVAAANKHTSQPNTTMNKSASDKSKKTNTQAKSAKQTAGSKKAVKTKAKPKSKKAEDNKSTAIANTADSSPPSIHPLVLAGVGAAALLYAGYEYRHDVANRIHQFRSYRAARRAARTVSAGR